jgi:REP element-mobilizing transposase RayT
MANTYSQIELHITFAVKYRKALLRDSIQENVHRYMTGIISNHGHKLLAIRAMPDHVHVLIELNPMQSLSELMEHLKGKSSKWLNEEMKFNGKFRWQKGYAAFSVSREDVRKVIHYIQNQDAHHRHYSFRDEFIRLLNENNVVFNPIYIFHDPE